MASSTHSSDSSEEDVVLVFGPQYLSFHHNSALALQSLLSSYQSFAWIKDALQGLCDDWELSASELPSLCALDGSTHLANLTKWLRTGNVDVLSFPLPNILLTPLGVAVHLAQYLDMIGKANGNASTTSLPRVSETLGLCTGHLSAAAVSCSKDKAQIAHYGAVAIRMAMLIGALVDARDVSLKETNRAKSLSVVWGPRNDSLLEDIIANVPQVQLPVHLDIY